MYAIRSYYAQVPQGRSLALVNDFAVQFAEEPEESRGSMLERVELRMQQMQAANARLQRFRHLINNAVGQMDDGLMVINSLGQVLMSNPRAALYLGRAPEEDLLGQDATRLLQLLEIRDVYHWQEVFHVITSYSIHYTKLYEIDTILNTYVIPWGTKIVMALLVFIIGRLIAKLLTSAMQQVMTKGNVITSYSIHYTKLYDLRGGDPNLISGAGTQPTVVHEIHFSDSQLVSGDSQLQQLADEALYDQDEFTRQAQELEIGTWLEMQDGSLKNRVKLSWKSKVTDTYIFVNRKGMKAMELTRNNFV